MESLQQNNSAEVKLIYRVMNFLAYPCGFAVHWIIVGICALLFDNIFLNIFMYEFLGLFVGSIVVGEMRYKKVGTLRNNFALVVFIIAILQTAVSFEDYLSMPMLLIMVGGVVFAGIALGALLYKVYVNKRQKYLSHPAVNKGL
ncbi:MAG: hypothetical protein IIV71_01330 [Bacteroidaceae bacterium]|nr:hypothetical protein [Bacteroidaceae bacterium]